VGLLFECTATVTIQTEMEKSLSVLQVDCLTLAIPIPRRRPFVAAVAVQTEVEAGESVSAPSRSLHHLLRFHCHFHPWRNLVPAGGGSVEGEALEVTGDLWFRLIP